MIVVWLGRLVAHEGGEVPGVDPLVLCHGPRCFTNLGSHLLGWRFIGGPDLVGGRRRGILLLVVLLVASLPTMFFLDRNFGWAALNPEYSK